MDGTTAIIVTLVVYKVTLVAIGVIAQRRTRDAADYFLGGRQLGPWVAALSASASSSSAWTLLGVSGYAYAKGLAAVWIFPACVGGFALNWYVIAPRLRRRSAADRSLTVTELLAGKGEGSQAIARVASAIILVSLLTYVAAQFQGAGKTFQETFGLSMTASVLIGASIVVVYTLLGGFWAVSITDTLQGMVMAVASILLPVAAVLAVGRAGGVPEGAFGTLTDGATGAAALGLVLGLLGIGLGYPGQPHVVNRFMALKDEASVVQGRRIAMAWAVVMYTGMIALGLCARVLFPSLADGEVAFVVATKSLFGPVVAGVMLAAVLSAIMSTADSQLLVAASAVAHDLAPAGSGSTAATARTTVVRSRVVVVALSAAAVGAALWGDPSIFKRVLFAWTAMGAAFGPVLLVELVRGRVPWRGRLLSIAVGFCTAVAAYLIPATAGGAIERVVPFALALAVAVLARRR